jgi:hypothetical protein
MHHNTTYSHQTISDGRRMLLESLSGHLALLRASHPRKAATLTARRAQRAVTLSLRPPLPRKRAA